MLDSYAAAALGAIGPAPHGTRIRSRSDNPATLQLPLILLSISAQPPQAGAIATLLPAAAGAPRRRSSLSITSQNSTAIGSSRKQQVSTSRPPVRRTRP